MADGLDDQQDACGEARHPVAAHAVAHDRDRHHAQSCAGQPLHQPQHQQHAVIADQSAGERDHDIGHEADREHRAAPEPVGKRAGEERSDPRTEEIGANHQLAFIARRTQFIRHHAKRRQHRIDPERLQTHQQRHQHNQLALPDWGGGVGLRLWRRGGGRGHCACALGQKGAQGKRSLLHCGISRLRSLCGQRRMRLDCHHGPASGQR